ncbi:glycerate kinase [Salirhabdus euzebyi]|uniref:Glycerate kinase n=1 Tax=Salirhabdus euzebyi TaxID=394506 RepID=A0A841Q633_9BACI|nr:glycerate kinase [Salirhabdus euzebyi]MBB6453823.1 glycerate kinase [Salirhabdus euzebyi]
MKIVIAPDSFKGSLSAKEVCEVMKRSCHDVFPDAHVTLVPLADGGEGTIDAFVHGEDGKVKQTNCIGPLGEGISTTFGILEESTAVIEVAKIAGLTLVPNDKRNPYLTTTFGVGQLINQLMNDGYKKIIIGLGGSATNDGGLGMLHALGAKFYDAHQQEVGIFGEDLLKVKRADISSLDPRLHNIEIIVACDVHNTLCGKDGASVIYGPQKGANPKQIEKLDKALWNYANVMEEQVNKDLRHLPGAGAAGGLGFALLSIGAQLQSGATLVAEVMGLRKELVDADFVLTGEGQSDYQTLYGKGPAYVAKLATEQGVPTILISGSVQEEEKLRELFTGCFSIMMQPITLTESMENAGELLFRQTKNVISFMKRLKEKP